MGKNDERWQSGVFSGGLLADAVLGTGSGHSLAQELAARINTPNTTVYDKAIDSVYLDTHVGGAQLHHLVDGQHDIFGAFEVASKALPDDSLWQEVMGTAQHLGKDLFSVSGLPVVSLSPETYQQSSAWLQETLHVPGRWLGDLLQVNALELFGGMLSAAAVVVGYKRADVRQLAELSAASGLAGMLSANPIGLCAGAVALVLAWKQKKEGGVEELLPSMMVGAGTVGTVSLVGSGLAAMGLSAGFFPAVGCLLISVVVGVYARKFLMSYLPEGGQADVPEKLSLESSEKEFALGWECPRVCFDDEVLARLRSKPTYQVSDEVRELLRRCLSEP